MNCLSTAASFIVLSTAPKTLARHGCSACNRLTFIGLVSRCYRGRGVCSGDGHRHRAKADRLRASHGDFLHASSEQCGESHRWHHPAGSFSSLLLNYADNLNTDVTERGDFPHSARSARENSTLPPAGVGFLHGPLKHRRFSQHCRQPTRSFSTLPSDSEDKLDTEDALRVH